MLSQAAAREVVHDSLFPLWKKEKQRLDRIDRWYRWDQDRLQLPPKATDEHKALAELAKTPWLNLVVTTVAQCMYCDGYRSALYPPDAQALNEMPRGPWRTWHANDMDSRQIAIHRAALAYGLAYNTVLPGELAGGQPTSVLRGVSPRKMVAVYAEPAEDDWPMYALQVDPAPGNKYLARLYDEEHRYFLEIDAGGDEVNYISYQTHGAGVTPVVRYANMLDLDGRATGEVEPFIGVAQRVNKTVFDRLLAQHFNSWKVRTIAGLEEPGTEEDARLRKMQLRQEDLLVAEDPDTKFGTLDETPLDGFAKAEQRDIESLAAVTQTPTNALTGQLANLNAEGIAAARAGLTQKVFERQKSLGKSHVQSLRLAAALEGDQAAADDVMARMSWQDMEIRSLSQAVDALGKAATMLNVPPQALWGRIPGFEQADVNEWLRMLEQVDPVDRLRRTLENQGGPADPEG